jgi:hypothetical protein
LTNLAPDSLETDPTAPSPVLRQLVVCLRELISQNATRTKPTLILNGDVLELALTTDNEAAMVWERFIELIMPADGERLFQDLVYIPGNHDHHLWETARETQYIRYLSQNKPPGSFLDVPWHATKMLNPDYVPCAFLEGLIRRYHHLHGERVPAVYPNYGLLSPDGQRCVIFSHGHFVESMYMLMSTLRALIFPQGLRPVFIDDIEAENYAWIDFFWSTMGRSGNVGRDVEILYDKLQSKAALEGVVDALAEELVRKFNRLPVGTWIETRLLRQLLQTLLFQVAHVERHAPEVLMTADASYGLTSYLEGPVLNQLKQELHNNIPRQVSFVFGHTHKPFQEEREYQGYFGALKVVNSGGWVIDSVPRQPLHGGAVILVDEELDITSLRLYNEAETRQGYVVRVETATHPEAARNPFHERIVGLVRAARDPWNAFSTLVYEAVPRYVRNLQHHIDQQV